MSWNEPFWGSPKKGHHHLDAVFSGGSISHSLVSTSKKIGWCEIGGEYPWAEKNKKNRRKKLQQGLINPEFALLGTQRGVTQCWERLVPE